MFGQPKKRPIKNANLKSPKPIHLPRDIETISKKKVEARIAEISGFNKGCKFPISKQIPMTKIQNSKHSIEKSYGDSGINYFIGDEIMF